ncbi:MAG: MFS transporter [Candidatus Bathyarchaeota archaeon]|jgi:MFS family permease
MLGLDRDLWFLFALNLAVGFSNQLINPLFPLYLESLGASEIQIGMVISTASVAATALMFPSGLLIDRVGKKRMLLASVVLSSVPLLLMASVRSWVWVTPFFMVFNAAFSLFIPSRMAMIAERATQRNRATLFGVMNMAWPISGIFAPTLSGFVIENFGWTVPFYIAGGIMGASLLPTILLRVRDAPEMEVVEESKRVSLRDPEYLGFMALFFLFHMAMSTGQGCVNTVLPLFLKNELGLKASTIGLFFTGASFLTLLTQYPSGWLADRYGRKRLILTCIAPIPLLYGVWPLVDNWMVLLVLNSLAFGLWSMTWPASLALLSDFVPKELRGSAFGVRMTGVRLGFTVGPLFGGYLYSAIGGSTVFMAAAASFLVGIVLAWYLRESPDD